jgi:hypothetical protein
MRCIILGGKIKSAEKKAIHHQSKKQDMPKRRLVNPSSIPKTKQKQNIPKRRPKNPSSNKKF